MTEVLVPVSVTSAFHGWAPLESSLSRWKIVPSMVGVLKVMESPLVWSEFPGTANWTL